MIYVTHREAPRFDWFADSLAAQLDGDRLEMIVVDGLHSPARDAELAGAIAGRMPFRHVPAKPTPWNGPHRLTRGDYFAAASARNTGIVYADQPYLVFLDDSCVLAPGWWERVRQAAHHGYVVAGSYRTEPDLVVREGQVHAPGRVRAEPERGPDPRRAATPGAIDSRWQMGDDDAVVRVDGGQLFGCCFGAPRSLLLEVNGLDELCDPAGGEDYHLGHRLAMAGARIFYDRRLHVIKDAGRQHRPAPLRLDKRSDAAGYMERLRAFGVQRRCTDGNWDSSHMVLDILFGTRRAESVGNYYRLADLGEQDLAGLVARFPHEHWFDGQPLAEI